MKFNPITLPCLTLQDRGTFAKTLVAAVLVTQLTACGGGDSSATPDNGIVPDGSTTDGTLTDGDTTVGSTTDGVTTANSGLSHTPIQMPQGGGAQLTGELFSMIGKNKAEALAQNPAIVFELVENHSGDTGENCSAIGAQYGSCSISNLHIKDTEAALDGNDWQLFFHSIRRVLRVDSEEFSVFHVNGDLHYLAPTAAYAGFGSTTVKTVKLVTEFSQLHESDFMPRYWLSRPGIAPLLLANTDNDTDASSYAVDITGDNQKAFNSEVTPIANSANRFDRFADVGQVDASSLVIPTPVTMATSDGSLAIGAGFNFDTNVLKPESIAALNTRLAQFHTGTGTPRTVITSLNTQLAANAYELVIDAQGIAISGGSDEAVFHGAQSLLALVTPGNGTIPQVSISDAPRFEYRGMHTDVARNFHGTTSLKKLIEQMSAYKLNRLHLHLSDDEGWRLEIPSLPELTSVGANRLFQLDADGKPTEINGLLPQLGSGPGNTNQGSGFISRAEFIDLLQYAKARFVQVIPELDMPGHARAAVVSMRARAASQGKSGDSSIRIDDPADTGQYLTIQHYRDGIINPCIDSSYRFISTVVNEVKSMFDTAGMRLETWHMGGDEANNIFAGEGFESVDPALTGHPWEKSPACQALIATDAQVNNVQDLTKYFIQRVSRIVNDAGISGLYAYHDILQSITPTDMSTSRVGASFWQIIWSGGYKDAYDWPNRGFETVISSPDFLYFDFPYEVDPKERGYYWATRFLDTRKVFSFAPENLPQNAETSVTRDGNGYTASAAVNTVGFKGMQGFLWSETIRTAEQFDYMVYPRVVAVAERAWHRGDWELDYAAGASFSNATSQVDTALLAQDWQRFANALGQKELAKLDAAGVTYRVPTAGAKRLNSTVQMNSAYPGLALEFSTDGINWQAYNPAAAPASVSQVRVKSANGARVGRATRFVE